MKLHPEYIAEDNAMGYMSDNGGDRYNLCHCRSPLPLPSILPNPTQPNLVWSNFEIADMDFWRGKAYQDWFNYLEEKGGFYYERWGDAPVHSIAAGLFLPKSKIHFFSEMGYEHAPYTHCPREEKVWKDLHCSCDQKRNFGASFLVPLVIETEMFGVDYDGYSCMKQWERIQ